jgi:shikimate kinase
MIHLVGPGGAGKSTVGLLLAERLSVAFVDLDRRFDGRFGDIGAFIRRHGYDAYARQNVELYRSLRHEPICAGVVALSSGFMTYDHGVHPEYRRVHSALEQCARTFVLLPFLDRERCVAETVRRQVARPFSRSLKREEAVNGHGSRCTWLFRPEKWRPCVQLPQSSLRSSLCCHLRMRPDARPRVWRDETTSSSQGSRRFCRSAQDGKVRARDSVRKAGRRWSTPRRQSARDGPQVTQRLRVRPHPEFRVPAGDDLSMRLRASPAGPVRAAV